MNKIIYVWSVLFVSSMLTAVYADTTTQAREEHYVGFTSCEHDLLRCASSKDPYILLGKKEIELFRTCAHYCKQGAHKDLQEYVEKLSNDMRILRDSSLNRVIWDALEVLSEQEKEDKQVSDLTKRLMFLRNDLREFAIKRFGVVQESAYSVYVCRGKENEWLGENRIGIQDDHIPFRFQLRQLVGVDASVFEVVSQGSVVATSVQSATPGSSILIFGNADFGEAVAAQEVKVANDHFVGTFTFDSIGQEFIAGNIARGIQINLARPPETGLFIKTIVTDKEPGGSGASISESIIYVQPDETFTSVSNEVIGTASILNRFVVIPTGSFSVDAPTLVAVLFAGDSDDVENVSLSYKVVGFNINTVVSASATFS